MLDPHILRQQPEDISERLATRGFNFDAKAFTALEEKRKALQVETQALQNERNQTSKSIGIAKQKGEDVTKLLARVAQVSDALEVNKVALAALLEEMEAISLVLPNIPHESVPIGKTEEDNAEIRQWGERPTFEFTPLSHDMLGQNLGQMDFATASKITGSRFVVMRSQLVRLQRALTQWMIDLHVTEHGYQEIYVPYIVNASSLIGTGQLPKFENDLFKLHGEHDYYLTSTAEVPVTNTVRECILKPEALPIQYVCHTPCFRSEAGSYGRDTKGLIRQHQFEKVELVWVTTPEESYETLERLTQHAETILQRLQLPYRVVALCTGDLGAAAAKTYDLEVWLPSQNTYREISSCSNMESYQARRMQARYKAYDSKDTTLVHTLNGSGLAIGRTLVAIMENYQDKDGNIRIPDVLHPYMGGITTITPVYPLRT